MTYIKVPMDIEKRSFEIIESEMGVEKNRFKSHEMPIVKRAIHTTADFNYGEIIEFSEEFMEKSREAILGGCKIYCDTKMIVNGLSKKNLERFGCEAYTLVSDPMVAAEAKRRGVTRSIVGMERAAKDPDTKIFLIGNAPTALFTLLEMIDKKEAAKPNLIVGVPVGFVGAAESKEDLAARDLPYILTKGRKGGSTVAVSILHGILYQLFDRKDF